MGRQWSWAARDWFEGCFEVLYAIRLEAKTETMGMSDASTCKLNMRNLAPTARLKSGQGLPYTFSMEWINPLSVFRATDSKD